MAGLKNALQADSSDPEDARVVAQMARLEAVLEVVPLAVALFDEELRLVRANQRYRDLTNAESAVAIGRSIYDAFPNTLGDLDDQIDRAVRGEPRGPSRIAFRLRSGAERMFEVTFTQLSMLPGAPASVGGLLFVGTDVSDREQLRADLARSIAQLESIFDVIPDSVRVFEADGKIVR